MECLVLGVCANSSSSSSRSISGFLVCVWLQRLRFKCHARCHVRHHRLTWMSSEEDDHRFGRAFLTDGAS